MLKIEKVLDNQLRINILSILYNQQWLTFNELKTMLQLTDGNLSTHLSTLEKHQYIMVKKEFVGKRPQSSYMATREGKKAFINYLDTLDHFLNNHK